MNIEFLVSINFFFIFPRKTPAKQFNNYCSCSLSFASSNVTAFSSEIAFAFSSLVMSFLYYKLNLITRQTLLPLFIFNSRKLKIDKKLDLLKIQKILLPIYWFLIYVAALFELKRKNLFFNIKLLLSKLALLNHIPCCMTAKVHGIPV